MTQDALPPISFCIPAKNNEDTIERCLKSILDIADEIVVLLDPESDDNTEKICNKYDCNVYKQRFSGFGNLRPPLVEKAQNDWIFFIDSDEEMPEDLKNEIREKMPGSDAVAYSMRKRTHMYGAWVHIEHVSRPHLVRRDVISFSGAYIGEKVVIKDGYKDRVEQLTHRIYHYTYDRVSDHIQGSNRYTSLEALEAVEYGQWYERFLLFYIVKGIAVCLFSLIYQRGILDGYRGLLYTTITFQYYVSIYGKIKDIERIKRNNPNNWKNIWLDEEC